MVRPPAYHPLVVAIICPILSLYLLVLVARAIFSFFPVTPGTALAQINEVLFRLTEPILGPVRRVIPAVGMFDLSFLVVVLALNVLRQMLCR